MIDPRHATIGKLECYDFETITVNTAVGLTASKLNTTPRPKEVFITVETAQIRYRCDGTNPDASTGHPLNHMDTLRVKGYPNLKKIKFIKTGSANGKISISYER